MAKIVKCVAFPLYTAANVVGSALKLIKEPYDLQSKIRWMQVTIANETDLRLVFDDTSYEFQRGRFWTSPKNIAANSESTFSVCNKKFGVNLDGRVVFRLEGADQSTNIVVGYVNKFFGNIHLTGRFEGEGAGRDAILNINGKATKVGISCAPGSEGKITIFYETEQQSKEANSQL
eukprot:Em0007g1013a